MPPPTQNELVKRAIAYAHHQLIPYANEQWALGLTQNEQFIIALVREVEQLRRAVVEAGVP